MLPFCVSSRMAFLEASLRSDRELMDWFRCGCGGRAACGRHALFCTQ